MTKWQTHYAKYGRATYLRNREKRLKQCRAYAKRNRARYREVNLRWRQANPEKARSYWVKYRAKNASICRKRCRENYAKNKANYRLKKIISNAKRYVAKRPELRAKWRAWASVNQPKLKAIWAKRRALKKRATINLAGITAFISAVKAKEKVACYYCKRPVLTTKIHFDHIVPLSRGGEHSARNLCVACPKCNLSKSNKPLEIWITIGQQLMKL